jgi:hypothetical protein
VRLCRGRGAGDREDRQSALRQHTVPGLRVVPFRPGLLGVSQEISCPPTEQERFRLLQWVECGCGMDSCLYDKVEVMMWFTRGNTLKGFWIILDANCWLVTQSSHARTNTHKNKKWE